MMALLGSLLLFRKRKQDHKKSVNTFRPNTFVFGFVENDFKVNCLSVKC